MHNKTRSRKHIGGDNISGADIDTTGDKCNDETCHVLAPVICLIEFSL